MSQLQTLYKNNPKDMNERVNSYIKHPSEVNLELNALETLLQSESFEKALAVFSIEILSKSLRKQEEFTRFIQIIFAHTEKTISYKNSIFILRILKIVLNTRFFVPAGFYLTKLLTAAFEARNLRTTNKKFSYDDVRLSSDDLQTEELQTFVIGESLGLIRKCCQTFGSNIGFPEYAFVICNELRSKAKIGAFKEIIADLISYINARKQYIEDERSKIKNESLNGKIIADFEASLKRWDE